jgi:hypothetical protein
MTGSCFLEMLRTFYISAFLLKLHIQQILFYIAYIAIVK